MTTASNSWKDFEYLNLSTQKRDGSWVNTPVWFAFDGKNTIYCFSENKAGKIKRLRNFREVKINPCTFTGSLLGEWQMASADILSDKNEVELAYQTLLACYGWKMRILNTISRLAGKINHRSFIKITV